MTVKLSMDDRIGGYTAGRAVIDQPALHGDVRRGADPYARMASLTDVGYKLSQAGGDYYLHETEATEQLWWITDGCPEAVMPGHS